MKKNITNCKVCILLGVIAFCFIAFYSFKNNRVLHTRLNLFLSGYVFCSLESPIQVKNPPVPQPSEFVSEYVYKDGAYMGYIDPFGYFVTASVWILVGLFSGNRCDFAVGRMGIFPLFCFNIFLLAPAATARASVFGGFYTIPNYTDTAPMSAWPMAPARAPCGNTRASTAKATRRSANGAMSPPPPWPDEISDKQQLKSKTIKNYEQPQMTKRAKTAQLSNTSFWLWQCLPAGQLALRYGCDESLANYGGWRYQTESLVGGH